MPPKSRKGSSAASQQQSDEIHQQLYGHLFEHGLVTETEGTVSLTMTPEQAVTLYRILSFIETHPRVRSQTQSHCQYLIALLRAVHADRPPAVFEHAPFVDETTEHDAPLSIDLADYDDLLE